MEMLRYKIRIAVLWVLMAVATSAHSIMVAMDPTAMEGAIPEFEAAGPGMWFFLALFWMVPLWLAFMSLTVKGSANRWVNFIVGIIFTILNIWHFLGCGLAIIEGVVGEPTAHHILLVGSTVVATALIAWYAWKWPKQEA